MAQDSSRPDFWDARIRGGSGRSARRVAGLVRPGGELAGFFYLDDNEKGPPFGIAPHALRALLEGDFELSEEKAIPPEHSIPVFKGKEVWQVWRRKL